MLNIKFNNMCSFAMLMVTAMTLLMLTTVKADDLDKVTGSTAKKLNTAVESQKSIDKTAETSNNLLQEYRAVNHQIEGLKIYNHQLMQQINNQQQLMRDLDYSISQVSVIQRQLPALMQNMLQSLEQFVAEDAPFHLAERQQRISQLKANLPKADISMAEKFRQLLEAYKIENEYGRKMDAYEDTVEVNEQQRKVNVLRIGRIALLYQTKDRAISGAWDREAEKWQVLDSSDYQSAIVRGLRIAKNQAAIDLLQLPVAYPEIIE